MPSTLTAPQVAQTLSRLHSLAAERDGIAERRVRWCEAREQRQLSVAERQELCQEAPLAVSSRLGRLLYELALARRPAQTVEFGSSIGVSTIYLAAAHRDAAGGTVITTELAPEKASSACANLAEVGLQELVEIRVGDARDTLCGLPGEVELVFLDGRSDQYLQLLRFLEPRLGANAVVVANLHGSAEVDGYLAHVGNSGRYVSSYLPLGAGVDLAVWTP